MKKIKWYFVLINLSVLLLYFNFSVFKKESLLEKGELVLFQLAPVDPRSLMQGDYMILRYSIADSVLEEHLDKRGYCVIQVDSNLIAKRIRFQPDKTPLHAGEKLIKYTAPGLWSISLGAESYFFQEGQAEKFQKAVFGGLKIDDEGNSLLIGLYDDKRQKIN